MALHAFDHHDGIIDHELDGQDDGQEASRFMVNPKACMRKTPPISDTGMATIRTRRNGRSRGRGR